MRYYLEEKEKVLKELDSTEEGLTDVEAKQRKEKYGANKLSEPPKEPIFKKILNSILDPMIIMLLVAAGISAFTAIIQNESFTDVFIILFVVAINTILGIIQESKAEKAIDSLKEMTAVTSKVLRNGKMEILKSEELVPGDIVILEAGDAISADCRILESHSMKIEEAAITGESVPVSKIIDILELKEEQKDISLGDRKNMLYSGSTVAYGRGKAVVVETGMKTEIGKIADALNQALDEQTPLQRKMAELSKVLTKIVLAISIFVFIFGIVRQGVFTGKVILDTFLVAIALAVAAIPEGLPAVVTIILSIGVTSMAKRKALIRKLTAVEALGCTQVICSDKTGTLTQNKMTVVDKYTENEELLAKAMCLCNDSKIGENDEHAQGEPTENALVEYAKKLGLLKSKIEEKSPRIGEVPFDSGRKMMSTIHEENGKYTQYTKGACEILLERCTTYLKNGNVEELTEQIKKDIMKQSKEFADKAYRVLGAAYVEYTEKPEKYESEILEKNMTFIGFVGMIDPCRKEVYGAIEECRKAGIRPIMITGDHKDTAVAIAKDLKIIKDAKEAITGAEIEELSDEELIKVVKKCSVYARVQPEHKTRIVKVLKSQNLITAMTGDGVNDAPSIKMADVGISMGITGTDVTKGVSDVVLADDNFATIVNAVEEGRKIYDNVRKVLQFQLSTNMAEVVAVFTSSVLGVTMLTPAHLLWINMVTDSAPGLALGMEKAEGDIMKRKPRKSNESVFSNGAGRDMIIHGLIMGFLVVLSFFIGEYMETGVWRLAESGDGMSMAFLTMNFIEMFHAVCMRSQRNSIFRMRHMNWWLLGAFILTTIFTLGIIYIPFFVKLFGFTSISFIEFITAFGLAFLIVPIIEITKLIEKKISKEI
ncbi:MAG: cation-translocating P-type ATPase [Clostridia bacterium]|nr:cation-translocating P-type ATPase [Clostridia bacterium]